MRFLWLHERLRFFKMRASLLSSNRDTTNLKKNKLKIVGLWDERLQTISFRISNTNVVRYIFSGHFYSVWSQAIYKHLVWVNILIRKKTHRNCVRGTQYLKRKENERFILKPLTPFVTSQPCSWQILPSISVVICKYVRWMKGSLIYIYSYIVEKL